MNSKFELTSEKKQVGGVTLYRIRALIDLRYCEKGEFGGWKEVDV